MDEVNKVSIPLCRYEELIDIETRVEILIGKLDQKEPVGEKDIYLLFGYTKKYQTLKAEAEKRMEKIMKEVLGECQESESATRNTEAEKESAVPI